MNVLAIDQGTSATKALVLDGTGRVIGEASAPVHPHSGAGGAVEQDPAELLDSVIDAGRRAVAAAGGAVGAVGIANQGETVLAWDPASGEPLGQAVSWQDRRAVAVTDELADEGERLTAITGLPLDPYFAAPKMTWLRRQRGEGGVISTVDAWINYRLAGAYVTDAATASRTLLLDLEQAGWSLPACELFGIDPSELPAIVDCAAPVGETQAFGASVPVTGLVVDQQAALFGESCFAPGEAKCTYGTGAFILATAGQTPVRSAARLASCVAWRLDGASTYCLDGQVYSAGSAASWLEQVGLIPNAAALDRAEGGLPGPDGPLFVPALAGLGAPFWAPTARGAWLGLSLSTSREELIRAFIWGLAAQVASLAHAMDNDLDRPIQALRVDGGLTRSAVLMQAQADLLQAPVELYPSPDATALGVAALARLGAGYASTPQDAVGEWSPAATFEPRIGPTEAQELLGRFDRAALMLATMAADER